MGYRKEYMDEFVWAASQQTFVLVKIYWRRVQCNIFYLSSKTSWKRLQDIIARRIIEGVLENILKTSCKDVLTASSRQLQDVFLKTSWKTSWRRLAKTWRRLEDVFRRRIANTSWRRLGRKKIVTLKTFSRRLEDVLKTRNVSLDIIFGHHGNLYKQVMTTCTSTKKLSAKVFN